MKKILIVMAVLASVGAGMAAGSIVSAQPAQSPQIQTKIPIRPAGLDLGDGPFLDSVHAQGVSGDDYALLGAGNRACDSARQGGKFPAMMAATGLDQHSATVVANQAIWKLCPEANP